jgi:hypothetical protein
MTKPRTDLPDPARSALRVAVSAVASDIAKLSGQKTTEENRTGQQELTASWGELVTLLSLGPEPEYRQCPACGHTGMRKATLCGYCWTKLSSVDQPPQ